MNSDSIKGFFIGCTASVLALMLFVFLFVLMCGLLLRGCAEAVSSGDLGDSISENLRQKAEKPEDEDDFTKVWVCGKGRYSDPQVLRIRLKGTLTDNDRHRLFESDETSSAPVALRQLRAAAKDKFVRGLWLEIDSPGGSVTMSDILHDAILRFKAAGTNRFVFVHMGDLCCSGGYYVAAPADSIMARPTSLTGSIGVIMNGINAATLAQKIGVESVTIASAANKDLLNPLKPVDPQHVEILKKPVSQMYGRFVSIVAKGRKLPEAKVLALADGRVFSAEDAKANGLVDLIGHDEDAMKEVCRLAGNKRIRVYRYRERPSFEKFLTSSFLFESTHGLIHELKAALEETSTPAAEYR